MNETVIASAILRCVAHAEWYYKEIAHDLAIVAAPIQLERFHKGE